MVLDQYGVIHLLFYCILLFSFVANCIIGYFSQYSDILIHASSPLLRVRIAFIYGAIPSCARLCYSSSTLYNVMVPYHVPFMLLLGFSY